MAWVVTASGSSAFPSTMMQKRKKVGRRGLAGNILVCKILGAVSFDLLF